VKLRASPMMVNMLSDLALEISDDVQQSKPMDSLEDCCDPEKMHSFQIPGAV
jgi:hypothetical protein